MHSNCDVGWWALGFEAICGGERQGVGQLRASFLFSLLVCLSGTCDVVGYDGWALYSSGVLLRLQL